LISIGIGNTSDNVLRNTKPPRIDATFRGISRIVIARADLGVIAINTDTYTDHCRLYIDFDAYTATLYTACPATTILQFWRLIRISKTLMHGNVEVAIVFEFS